MIGKPSNTPNEMNPFTKSFTTHPKKSYKSRKGYARCGVYWNFLRLSFIMTLNAHKITINPMKFPSKFVSFFFGGGTPQVWLTAPSAGQGQRHGGDAEIHRGGAPCHENWKFGGREFAYKWWV